MDSTQPTAVAEPSTAAAPDDYRPLPYGRFKRGQPNAEEARRVLEELVALQRQMVEKLLAGDSLIQVALDLAVARGDVKRVAEWIGWQPQWRRFANQASLVVGPNCLTWGEISRLRLEEKKTLQEIADLAGGVSRERIRQVCYYMRVPTEDKATGKRITRRNTHFRQQVQEKREMLAQLWAEGRTIREIAEELSVTQGSAASMVTYARKVDPELFPYRHTRSKLLSA